MTYTPIRLSDRAARNPLGDNVAAGSSVRSTFTAVASAVPHAAPATWSVIDASLSADCGGIDWSTIAPGTSAAATNTSTLIEFGTGSLGTEVVIATIGAGYRLGDWMSWIPCFIPAGTRLVWRVRSAVSSKQVSIAVNLRPAVYPHFPATPLSLGFDYATSRGLTIAAPGSLNTKGAWTDLTTNLAADVSVLAIGPQAAGATVMQNASGILVDIGFDPTGGTSYQTLVEDIGFLGSNSEFYAPRNPLTYGAEGLVAGSRVAARYAQANAANTLDLTMVLG